MKLCEQHKNKQIAIVLAESGGRCEGCWTEVLKGMVLCIDCSKKYQECMVCGKSIPQTPQ